MHQRMATATHVRPVLGGGCQAPAAHVADKTAFTAARAGAPGFTTGPGAWQGCRPGGTGSGSGGRA